MVRDDGDGALDFDWGRGSPGAGCGVPSNDFSARWTRTVDLDAGTYRFTVTTDDGARLSVDGDVVIDAWRDQPPTASSATINLPGGEHTIRLEYYESGGSAAAELTWRRLSSALRASGRRAPVTKGTFHP